MALPTIYANFAFVHSVPAGDNTPANGYGCTLTANGSAEFSFSGTYNAAANTWDFAATITEAGVYRYAITFNNISGKFLVETGRVDVLADPTAAVDTDQRSFAERTLEVVEAVIEKKATKDQLNYSIAGRSITKYSFKELMDLRKELKREIALTRKDKPRTITYRFTRG